MTDKEKVEKEKKSLQLQENEKRNKITKQTPTSQCKEYTLEDIKMMNDNEVYVDFTPSPTIQIEENIKPNLTSAPKGNEKRNSVSKDMKENI